MSSQNKRTKTVVEKFVSKRHQFSVGQKVLDRFTVTTPAVAGTLGEDYHAIDTRHKKPYVLQVLIPDIANNFQFIDSVASHLYVCGSIKEQDLVPAGELLQDGKLCLRMIAAQDYGHESVESRQEIIEAGGKFGVKALLGFLERAAVALDKLTLAGRAHLALRPSDIIITSHGTVMVTNWWYNWDLLKAAAQGQLGSAATVQNTLLSSKHSTLAPETFQALRIIAGFEGGEFALPSTQADQYSLALIFGRTLNRAAVVPATAPLTAVTLDLGQVPFLNQAQRQILQRAMADEPMHRFESCTAFLKALQWELPGTEYMPDQGFHDLLFEHVLTHQGRYSDGDLWGEFLNLANERKVFAANDNIELLKRARYIWEVHLGHSPDTPSAPLQNTLEGGDAAAFDTSSETPKQRFDRLSLQMEELRLGVSTSGFGAAGEAIELLEKARAAFERCNPEGSSEPPAAVKPAPAAAKPPAAARGSASARPGAKGAMHTPATPVVRGSPPPFMPPPEPTLGAELEAQPAGGAGRGEVTDTLGDADEATTAELAAMIERAKAGAAARVAASAALQPETLTGEPAPAAPSASSRALEAVREHAARMGADGPPGPAAGSGAIGAGQPAVDPIALLDAFAPAAAGSGPTIDPPAKRPSVRQVPAGPAAANAMLTEFRESVRMTRPVAPPADPLPVTPSATPARQQPSAQATPTLFLPPGAPQLAMEVAAVEAAAAESAERPPLVETGEPHIDYANWCARCGDSYEILECRFSFVPDGQFVMGREVGKTNERPTHTVQLSTGYFLSMGTVTNKDYKYFVDATGHPPPGHPRHPERNIWTPDGNYPPELEDHPVVNVTWNDARLFCAWLTEWSQQHDLLMRHAAIELPTEAQWEFACRGGPSQMRLKQQTVVCDRKEEDGWPTVPSLYEPAPPLSLCGMLGNVWEWTLDGYAPYKPAPDGGALADPIRNPEGVNRVIRGGGWRSKLDLCNPYERAELPSHRAEKFLGFRLCITYRPQV